MTMTMNNLNEGDIVVYKGGKYRIATQNNRPLNRKKARAMLVDGKLKKRGNDGAATLYTFSAQ